MKDWAVILGGSSGFGLATAKKLASEGMGVCVIHRDLRGAMKRVEPEFEEIRGLTDSFLSFNTDALSVEGRRKVVGALGEAGVRVRLLLHSIAAGNLKPLVPDGNQPILEDEDMAYTIYGMGTSLLSWVQAIYRQGLFTDDSRVLALTSEGARMAWAGYGAVSAAKASLEAVMRSIALEYAPHGIRANVIQAGVTDTPALRRIPGSDRMKELAVRRNPFKRLTRPEDVADFISLLCRPEARWVNGAVLCVDGGESIASL